MTLSWRVMSQAELADLPWPELLTAIYCVCLDIASATSFFLWRKMFKDIKSVDHHCYKLFWMPLHFVKASKTHMLNKLSTVTLITSLHQACRSILSQNLFFKKKKKKRNGKKTHFPCHTCQCLQYLKVSHWGSNSIHSFIFEDIAMCSACR